MVLKQKILKLLKSHKQTMRNKYLLRNTSKCDVHLGDLRYKIPAGQTRDLLSYRSGLNEQDVNKSINSGSIAARLRSGVLIEVTKVVKFSKQKKTEANLSVKFPRNAKSGVKLDIDKLDDQLNDMVLNEEDELLKELQYEDLMGDAPIVQKQNNDPET